MKKTLTLVALLFFGIITITNANVNLPAIFGDHMVLQQNAEITIWGWASPTEEISLYASWGEDIYETVADNHARWEIKISTPGAGGPYEIAIQGYNRVVLEDVLIGEVWLGSGQSNMEWSANLGIDNAAAEIAAADYPEIRFFQVQKRSATTPQIDLEGEWVVCTPETMDDFSAIGYYFGRALNQTLNVPIGVINSSWGGTPAEAWVNPKAIESNPVLSEAANKIPVMPWCPEAPGSTYNSMIAPLIPFKIAGVIWYQGETNTSNAATYATLFTTLINNWREEWDAEFPVYYVQIAPFKYETPEVGVQIRAAQLACLAVPNTGMVVVSDIGNIDDIHPKNKKDVGIRLANWALAKTYVQKDVDFSGPVYKNIEITGNKIEVHFDYASNGLVAKDGPLTGFEIAGDDMVFVEAKAKISGNSVIVSAKQVKNPQAVRFAWSNIAEPNLFNKAGLPASCFNTSH